MKDIFAALDGQFKDLSLQAGANMFVCACVFCVSEICVYVCVCVRVCVKCYLLCCVPLASNFVYYTWRTHTHTHAHTQCTHTHTFARVDPHAHTYLHSLAKYCSTQTSLQIFRHNNDRESLAILFPNFLKEELLIFCL